MRERLPEIEELDAEVVVVTFASARVLASYQRRFASPFTVVADEDRLLYAALGFGRGSVWRVWGWRAAKKYAELIRAGARPERSGADTLQLGGNAIVEAGGRLAWRYSGAGPDDRPEVDDVLQQLRSLQD